MPKSLHHCCRIYCSLDAEITALVVTENTALLVTVHISGLFKGKQIMDMSNLYKKYKDLNEMLVASRGYNKNMSIKH